MESKNNVLCVRVNLAESVKKRHVSSFGVKPVKPPIHKSTLSLNIPSEASPRMVRIKKCLHSQVTGGKTGLKNQTTLAKASLSTLNLIPKVKFHPNKENVNPSEISSTLLKTSRRQALNSILLTSHSTKRLIKSLKHC
jgi:hypothetical protein